jgi:hypothetical protein
LAAGEGKSLPSQPLAGGSQKGKGRIAMTYGLSTRAFIEDGPSVQVAHAKTLRSTARNWRTLDEANRLQIIELALHPANDRVDAFPLAL